jgi:hypothetical protein
LQITPFSHSELPLKKGDKVNMAFWEIDAHGKDCLYQWWFLFFGLKNTFRKFHQFRGQMLVNFGFVK